MSPHRLTPVWMNRQIRSFGAQQLEGRYMWHVCTNHVRIMPDLFSSFNKNHLDILSRYGLMVWKQHGKRRKVPKSRAHVDFRTRRYHFAHPADTGCRPRNEATIHSVAQFPLVLVQSMPCLDNKLNGVNLLDSACSAQLGNLFHLTSPPLSPWTCWTPLL